MSRYRGNLRIFENNQNDDSDDCSDDHSLSSSESSDSYQSQSDEFTSDSDSESSINIKKHKRRIKEREKFNDLCKIYGFDYKGIIKSSYGCEHYHNGCKIYCKDCPKGNNIYPCHKCHNEHMMRVDMQNRVAKNNKDCENVHDLNEIINIHELESSSIQHVQCIRCNHKQPFNDVCENCNKRFAGYICYVCKLMDNRTDENGDAYDYYHCSKCKCCLVGNRNDFSHCDNCEMCVQKNMLLNHPCRKGMWDIDKVCTICQTGIKTQMSVIMVCGHMVHQDCFNVLIQNSYKCPECSKSIKDTRKIFTNLAKEIESTPLHPDLQKIVKIKCNDCGKQNNTDFHYVGIRCPDRNCKSFNTYEIDP